MSAIFGGPAIPGTTVTSAQISDATTPGKHLLADAAAGSIAFYRENADGTVSKLSAALQLAALGALAKTILADTTLTGAFTLAFTHSQVNMLPGILNYDPASVVKVSGNASVEDSFLFVSAGAGMTFLPVSAFVLLTADTGWTANADAGDKTKVIGTNASLAAMEAALNLVLAGFGTSFVAVAEKVKALEDALVNALAPNA